MSSANVIRLPSASPNADVRALQEVDDFASTDMGWGGEDKWTYRILTDEQITTEMLRLSQAHGVDGHVDHISFQPCQSYEARSQDRYVVQIWDLPGGQWTFSGVFDGKFRVHDRQTRAHDFMRAFTFYKATVLMGRSTTSWNTCRLR